MPGILLRRWYSPVGVGGVGESSPVRRAGGAQEANGMEAAQRQAEAEWKQWQAGEAARQQAVEEGLARQQAVEEARR